MNTRTRDFSSKIDTSGININRSNVILTEIADSKLPPIPEKVSSCENRSKLKYCEGNISSDIQTE